MEEARPRRRDAGGEDDASESDGAERRSYPGGVNSGEEEGGGELFLVGQ